MNNKTVIYRVAHKLHPKMYYALKDVAAISDASGRGRCRNHLVSGLQLQPRPWQSTERV